MEDESKFVLNRINTIQRYTIAVCILSGITLIFAILMATIIIGVHFNEIIISSPPIKFVYYTLLVLSVLFVLVRLISLNTYPLFNKNNIVLALEKKNPFLNTTLISAFQFIKKDPLIKEHAFSKNLISLLINEAFHKVLKLNLLSIVDKNKLKLYLSIFISISIIFAINIIFDRQSFMENAQSIFKTQEKATATYALKTLSSDEISILGDITLRYNYPQYTGLKPKTVANSNGDIEAIKGSEVIISAISSQLLQTASIVINEKTIIPLAINNKNKLEGVLKLFENGNYTFAVVKNDGLSHVTKDHNTIKIIEDIYPNIVIANPQKDQTLSEKDSISLEYKSSDDFGIAQISLHYSINSNNEKRIVLKNFRNNKREFHDEYVWNLSTVNLKPGDRVAYHLEAMDNDTVSGPKISSTETYNLKIYSYEQRHNDILNSQTNLVKEMKRLLGIESINLNNILDNLTDPPRNITHVGHLITSREYTYQKSQIVLLLFNQTIKEMANDVLADYTVYHILNNTMETFRQLIDRNMKTLEPDITKPKKQRASKSFLNKLRRSYSTEIGFLRNNIPILEDLLDKQVLEDLERTTDDLLSYRNEIDNLFNEANKNRDASMDNRIINELKNLKDAIEQIMKKLASHLPQSSIPEDQKMTNLSSLLSQLSDSINNKDLDTALSSAKNLLDSLWSTLNNLNNSFMQNTNEIYSQLLDSTSKLLEQIKDLETKEEELTANTTDLKDDISERTRLSKNSLFDKFFNKLKESLNKIVNNLSEAERIVSQPIDRGKQIPKYNQKPKMFDRSILVPNQQPSAIIKKKFNQLNKKIIYLSAMLDDKDVKESLNLSRETLKILNGLAPIVFEWNKRKPAKSATKPKSASDHINSSIALNKEIINGLETFLKASKQSELNKLTAEEERLLKEYAKTQRQLKDKSSSLRSKAKELEQNNPFCSSGLTGNIGRATNLMESASQNLDSTDISAAILNERESLYYLGKTKKSLQESMQMMSKGMMGKGIPMPSLMKGFRGRFNRYGSDGIYGASTEDVEIPSEEMYKVPEEFREEILKSMEANFPKRYEELNKGYFIELLQ